MNTKAPANLKQLSALLRKGEGPASFEEPQAWMLVTFSARIAQVEARRGAEKSSERILDLVKQNPAVSAREIAEALDG